MAKRGLLIDYTWCTGCHACEVACKQEHGYRVDQWGIVVDAVGPMQISENRWSFDFVPTPTDLCNLCRHRTVKNLPPSCVQHCPTVCIEHVEGETAVASALERVRGSQRVVFFNK